MTSQLKSRLRPVRARQRLLSAYQGVAWGLIAGGAAASMFGLARWLLQLPVSVWWGAAAIVAGMVIGVFVGLMRRMEWQSTAKTVDQHYLLKDRTATALAFSADLDHSLLRKLQVADALEHLTEIEPKRVVPYRTPRTLPYAIATTVAATVILFVSVLQEPIHASPSPPLDVVLVQAERFGEELQELEEFAKQDEQKDVEIQKLVDELKLKIEELKQPGVDQREALAKLSEMQAKLQAQQQQYDVSAVDSQMQALAEALSLAESFASVSKPLKEGKYESAADELEKAESPQLDRQTEKALKEKLASLSEAMREAGQQQLGQSTGDISEGLGEDSGKFREGAKKLAGECRKQGRRKKLHDLLQRQCQCLGECKSECEGDCENKSEGQSKGKGGKNWGLGASGNDPGDPTASLGANQKEQLTGKLSDEGESEVESTVSPEGKQEAQRGYRATYDKYRKMSEAVLDSEPIPLGHRQTIRRYFESIRPETGDSEKE